MASINWLGVLFLFVIMVSIIVPAYAEVTSLKTNKTFYIPNDKIYFTGTVSKDDFQKQINLVIHDPDKGFVLITGGFSNINDTFQIMIDTSDPDIQGKFSLKGTYNATAFITKEANGTIASFDFSPDGSPVIHPKPSTDVTQTTQNNTQSQQSNQHQNNTQTSNQPSTINQTKSIQQLIEERIALAKKLQEEMQNMPNNITLIDSLQLGDAAVNPLDRSSNSNSSSNHPVTSSQKDATQFNNLFYPLIALGGVGIVVGILYGRKNHFFNKTSIQTIKEIGSTEQPSNFSDTTHDPSDDDYAMMILRNRLAKGEITIEEFNDLRDALKEP